MMMLDLTFLNSGDAKQSLRYYHGTLQFKFVASKNKSATSKRISVMFWDDGQSDHESQFSRWLHNILLLVIIIIIIIITSVGIYGAL